MVGSQLGLFRQMVFAKTWRCLRFFCHLILSRYQKGESYRPGSQRVHERKLILYLNV